MTVTKDQIQSLYDAEVLDSGGQKVGGVGQVYLDDQSGEPAWVTVKTGLFGTNETFVPLQDADVAAGEIRLPYTKDFIKGAPNIGSEGHLDDNDQQNLFNYYSVGSNDRAAANDRGANNDVGTSRSDTGTAGADVQGQDTDTDRSADSLRAGDAAQVPAGAAAGYETAGSPGTATTGGTGTDVTAAGTVDPNAVPASSGTAATETPATGNADTDANSVVRREEQLKVHAENVEAGRLRIRKHVVTEMQTVTVPVEHEEVEVVREPIADGQTGGTLGDDDVEVTLHAERPVVDKEVVDKERVGINRQTVTENQDVSAEVGREEVQIEHDGDVDNRGVAGNRNAADDLSGTDDRSGTDSARHAAGDAEGNDTANA